MSVTLYAEPTPKEFELPHVVAKLRLYADTLLDRGDTFDREAERLEQHLIELEQAGTPILNPEMLRHRVKMRRDVIGPSIDIEAVDRHACIFTGHVARTRIFLTLDNCVRGDVSVVEMERVLRECGATSVEVFATEKGL